jgi:hypothetical protein
MDIVIKDKLKFLHQHWPRNAVLTTAALRAKGYSDQLIQKYCFSGWLQRLGTGAFVRQSDQALWEGGLYAIQHDLNKPIHLGGLTALEMHGLSHYLRLSSEKTRYLYNTSASRHTLPSWFSQYFNKKKAFHYTQCHIFNEAMLLRTEHIEGLDLQVSSPEQAILEALYLVPKQLSVEHASQLVENLQTIVPDQMQQALENCRHILVKRLFLCLADLCQLPVLKHLNLERIELGSGERTIPPGGKYYSKYKLTLPYKGDDSKGEEINV